MVIPESINSIVDRAVEKAPKFPIEADEGEAVDEILAQIRTLPEYGAFLDRLVQATIYESFNDKLYRVNKKLKKEAGFYNKSTKVKVGGSEIEQEMYRKLNEAHRKRVLKQAKRFQQEDRERDGGVTKADLIDAIKQRRGPIVANRIAISPELCGLKDTTPITMAMIDEWAAKHDGTLTKIKADPQPLSEADLQLIYSVLKSCNKTFRPTKKGN